LKKPLVVFVDDLEKVKGDRVQHFTRSEKTLQLLEEVRPMLELPRIGFVVALQEEFYSMVGEMVKEGGQPTVLGLFKHVVLVGKFTPAELKATLAARLKAARFKGEMDDFLDPDALSLALAFSYGNPRRFIYLLSEGMYRAFNRKAERVEFQDFFDFINEHTQLDTICRKILFFLAKSGRVVASNSDLQKFLNMDTISIARRLEALAKNRLAELVDTVDGSKVYSLPGIFPTKLPEPSETKDEPETSTAYGGKEKMFLLDGEAGPEK
jgi:hypothetical protein